MKRKIEIDISGQIQQLNYDSALDDLCQIADSDVFGLRIINIGGNV